MIHEELSALLRGRTYVLKRDLETLGGTKFHAGEKVTVHPLGIVAWQTAGRWESEDKTLKFLSVSGSNCSCCAQTRDIGHVPIDFVDLGDLEDQVAEICAKGW